MTKPGNSAADRAALVQTCEALALFCRLPEDQQRLFLAELRAHVERRQAEKEAAGA